MLFFDNFLFQNNKRSYSVCGDYCFCRRTPVGMIYVLCDGIGSGIYANISAISCGSRIMELFDGGLSIRETAETVAASMHRARKEEFPFSAFSIAMILPDGQFNVYFYESPVPVLLQDGHAAALLPHFYTVGFEIIGETSGILRTGDSLFLFSDGVSQAGLGRGYGLGIGSDGVADFINRNYKLGGEMSDFPGKILKMCREISGGEYEDDSTIAALYCREAEQMTLLTGPPGKQSLDSIYAADFMGMPGKKAICGSTTTDIISREIGRKVVILTMGKTAGQLPEYEIEGIDIVAEGAITLNQVYNILDEPLERLTENSVVERLCAMLHEADVVNLMIGSASNAAHEDLIFKQIGVSVRKSAIKGIVEKLREMGKLVVERYY